MTVAPRDAHPADPPPRPAGLLPEGWADRARKASAASAPLAPPGRLGPAILLAAALALFALGAGFGFAVMWAHLR